MKTPAPCPAPRPRWDIFCKVIDNLGDMGVCWRLARQLAAEHGLAVRLLVDAPGLLAPLLPALDPSQAEQEMQGVRIGAWTEALALPGAADVVVEAFACDPPAAYLEAMGARPRPPCWINLEYLSAEAWVAGCHGAASPHPRLPLVKFFFFPGFGPGTGGLLRERGLLARRDAFLVAGGRETLLQRLGLAAGSDTLLLSLFCYDTAPLEALFRAWSASSRPLLCLVPPGKPLAAASRCLGGDGPWQLGPARIVPIPFLSQADYDELLWSCDLNFVRGEDSFVRAQWAGRPFVWQIYAQEDGAHLEKLEAFLALPESLPPGPGGETLAAFWRSWNGASDAAPDWEALVRALPLLDRHGKRWSEKLGSTPNLAASLVKFCESRV